MYQCLVFDEKTSKNLESTLKLMLTICKSFDPVGDVIFLGLERMS